MSNFAVKGKWIYVRAFVIIINISQQLLGKAN